MNRSKRRSRNSVKHEGSVRRIGAGRPEFLRSNYPSTTEAVEQRIRRVVDRISNWPESSPRVIDYPAIHAAPLGRYPYRMFYLVTDDAVEIVHIHHTSRQPFWEENS